MKKHDVYQQIDQRVISSICRHPITAENRDCLVTIVDKIIIFLFYFIFSGDTFEKLEDEDEQGWCKGRKDGKVGLYPANYIEVV